MIHAVTFDFWETLVHDSAENMRDQRMLRIGAVHRVLGRAGRMLGLADVVDAYDRSEQVLVERFWSRDRDPAIAEQVRLVLETASPGAPDAMTPALFEEAVAGYIEPVLQMPPELEPRTAEAVRELASRGIALGIVSSGTTCCATSWQSPIRTRSATASPTPRSSGEPWRSSESRRVTRPTSATTPSPTCRGRRPPGCAASTTPPPAGRAPRTPI